MENALTVVQVLADLVDEPISDIVAPMEKCLGSDPRITLLGPILPASLDALDATAHQTKLFTELQSHSWALLKPLLEIVRIDGTNISPLS